MRLAIVSDIHGNLPALAAVVQHAGTVDGWLNLGDSLAGPLWPAETAALLMALRWPTIAGNHERQMLAPVLKSMGHSDRYAAARLNAAQRHWLAAQPPQMNPVPGVYCVHGTPASDTEGLLETVTPQGMRAADGQELVHRLRALPDAGQAQLVLCGHTHTPRHVRLGALQLLNPGSVGLPAYDHDQPFEHVVENGSPQARYATVTLSDQGWTCQLHGVDYDHESAALKAEANGRGDWADALRTGRVGRRGHEVQGLD